MSFRQLLKLTYHHIKSKRFRSYLILFYRKNIKIVPSKQQIDGWSAILDQISQQQKMPREARKGKFIFENVLVNYKGFQLNIEPLSHLPSQMIEEMLHIFIRLQIIYVHSIDSLKGEKPYRLFSTLDPKRPYYFLDYYCKMTPQQKLGVNYVDIPTIGKWQTLFPF